MTLNYIHWNPNPEIINLFGLSLRYYGLLFVGGIVLCVYLLKWIFKKEDISQEKLDILVSYSIFGVVLGARLGHCLFYEPDYFLAHPLEMILPGRFVNGGFEFTGFQGLASHGGVLGLLIALALYARKTKESLINTFDLIAVVAGLSFAFIRLANFMNSEIIGMPSDISWAVIFDLVDSQPRHPAQLYEGIAYFFIFILMFSLYLKFRPQLKNGSLFGLATVLFFIARFLIEFVKENQVAFEEGMSLNMGQILSIPFIFVGVALMVYGLKKTKEQQLS